MAYDVIIIGSGFGGAVTACRLAEKGMKVLVLERGRRWNRQNFPSVTDRDYIWDSNHPEKCNGWFDFRVFKDMTVVQGAGVGGGSLMTPRIAQGRPSFSVGGRLGRVSPPTRCQLIGVHSPGSKQSTIRLIALLGMKVLISRLRPRVPSAGI